MVIISSTNQQNHSNQQHLSEQYFSYLQDLSSLREAIVTELQDILFGTQTPKSSGMEKQEEVTRK